MNHSIRPLIAGNWKMNGGEAALAELEALASAVSEAPPECDVTVCVPATLVNRAAHTTAASAVSIGGQDCHTKPSGAHTGDVSAEMLADAGAAFVIVGHSERRADHAESDADVRAKAEAAFRAGLTPIICVGETEAERRSGEALAVVRAQLAGSLPETEAGAGFVVAYEPVWAIGTGLTPTGDDIAEMHAEIRKQLQDRMGKSGAEIAILYGGSMKPGNAAEILAIAHVNGGLVGGASLKADDFITIVRAA